MTYRKAIYALIEKFRQTNDDSKITPSLVAFNLQIVANAIMYQHLKKKETFNTGSYLTVFDKVAVVKNSKDSTFELPSEIFDFNNDGGIEFIAYQLNKECGYLTKQFSRTTPGKLGVFSGNPFIKPSPEKPLFWLAGNIVHLAGIDCVDVDTVIVGLHTTASTKSVCDLDSRIPIPEQYSEVLLIRTEALLRFAYAVTPERRNDGTDTSERLNSFSDQLQIPIGSEQPDQ